MLKRNVETETSYASVTLPLPMKPCINCQEFKTAFKSSYTHYNYQWTQRHKGGCQHFERTDLPHYLVVVFPMFRTPISEWTIQHCAFAQLLPQNHVAQSDATKSFRSFIHLQNDALHTTASKLLFVFQHPPAMPPHVLVDFMVFPLAHGRCVTDFWGWNTHEAQLHCPDDVSGDIGGCSARRALKPKFY